VVQQGGHVAVATGLDGCPLLTDDPTTWRWLPLIVPHKSGTLGAMVVALSVTTATTTGQCHDHQKELGAGVGTVVHCRWQRMWCNQRQHLRPT
jgi:hypothetical protein